MTQSRNGAGDVRSGCETAGERLSRQPYRHGELIHQLFRQRAIERPDAVAVVQDDAAVTYGDLLDRAERFAARLAGAGVGPGCLVPVVLPRSIDLVVAFLGVLMRGAAYAALDPRWPATRRDQLIAALASPAVVVSGEGPDVQPTCIVRSDAASALDRGTAGGAAVVAGDSPAAVYFTSGTTGAPKGAISPHRGTVRLFQDCTFATFDERTVMPLTAAVPWDALTLELWGVLLNGGRSVVVTEPYLLPGRLNELVARHGVNTVSFTSSVFNLFAEESVASFAGLSQVFVGGERVSPGHLERVLRRFPELHLLHCYGPVESTLFASTHRVVLSDCGRPDGIPLGEPVPNTGLHVWEGTRLCGPGEVGELLISGDGLAAAYLDDADETARRFPTMTIGGVRRRVYRTGDLVHWSADGSLHFDGRADRQVKIRGHRIEPAEIERTALGIAGVGECAAVPVPGRGDAYDGILLAYTSRSATPVAEGQLRELLRAQLPSYLVPASVMRVAALPLNENGKLDAAALLALRPAPGVPTEPDEADEADDLTRAVSETVSSVLGLARVPGDVDIVALGGTSLDLGVICTRLAARFGVALPISEVIGRSSVHGITDRLLALVDRATPTPSGRGRDDAAAALTGMQETFLLRQMRFPADLTGLCPFAWRLTGPVDEEALAQAVQDVHGRHQALRARYGIDERYHDDQPFAVVDDHSRAAHLDRVDAESDEEAVGLLHRSLLRPLDIEVGDLWRAVLVRVRGTERALFGIVVHHIAFDGRSEHILARDLSAAYGSRRVGDPPVFEGTSEGLAGTARLLEDLRAHSDTPAVRRRWRESLRDVPELALPLPPPGTAAQVAPGSSCAPATRTFRLAPDDVAQLESAAGVRNATPFTLWLAAFAAAVREVTGQQDFGIGVPTSSREGVPLTDTIGCLIDVVCLRMRPSGGNWDRLVEHARDTLNDALAMQALPLTEVVRLVKPARTGRDPLYQVMLVYQDSPRGELHLTGVTTEPVRVPSVQATSEVVTELWPTADGGMDIDVTYQADRVAETFAVDVVEALSGVTGRVAAAPAEAMSTSGGGSR